MTTRDTAFWHPMLHPNEMKQREPIRILRGEGCFVFDDKGNRLVDGVAGLWNVNVGHGRAEIKAAITAQLDELEYFQLFDGIQGVITGTLRGLGNTHTPMKVNLVAHWLLGLPTSYLLCFIVGWGVWGLWIGLSLGLIVTGVILFFVWTRDIRQYREGHP